MARRSRSTKNLFGRTSAFQGGVNFTFEGEQDIIDALKELEASVTAEAMEAALQAGAEILVDGMRDKLSTHRRTGELSRSLGMETTMNTKYNCIVLVGMTKAGFYGRFLEYGTSNIKGDRYAYARPTWDERKDEVNDAIIGVLAEAVTKS